MPKISVSKFRCAVAVVVVAVAVAVLKPCEEIGFDSRLLPVWTNLRLILLLGDLGNLVVKRVLEKRHSLETKSSCCLPNDNPVLDH